MSICKYPVPIEWAMRIENNLLVPDNKAAQNIRSQDITPKYFDCGMFYFCRTSIMRAEKTMVPRNTLAYIIDETEMHDIDTADDWKIAEMKYRILTKAK